MKKILKKLFMLTAMFCFAGASTYADGYDLSEEEMENQVSPAPESARTYPEGSAVYYNGLLTLKGNQLVNECGKPVQLRGMSSHGLAWFPRCYTQESLTALVNDWHIDIFRLAIYTHEWGGYCGEQWKSKSDYNTYIDELVDICGNLGIYCIIDWHILNQGSGDPNTTLDDAIPFWDYMSAKHKNDKHVLYEICNEPNGFDVKWSDVKQYAEEVIPVIRKNDPDKIIICGTPTWSQDVDIAAQNPLDFSNVMYTLHFYSGTHTQYLRDKAQKALDKGLAIFVTEFGTTQSSGDGGVYISECNTWMDWMDERKISWVNWSFADKSESSSALSPGASNQGNWNMVSESGQYIKRLLSQPKGFEPCNGDSLTTPEYVENVNPMAAIKYPKGSPVYHNGKLHVQNGRLTNECDFDVQLRGLSSDNLSVYSTCYTSNSLNAMLNDWNASLFRISVHTNGEDGYCVNGSDQGISMYNYNDKVDNLVRLCGTKGIYCVVNWHLTGKGDPNANMKEATIFWRHMAQRYKNYSHVLFEICDNTNGVDWSSIKSYADSMISLIRQFDKEKIIICGTPSSDREWEAVAANPLAGDNIMYTMHFAAGSDGQTLREKANATILKGLPLFVTEFSLSSTNGGSINTTEGETWIDWMKSRSLSWTYANFADGTQTNSALNNGACGSRDWTSVSASGEFVKAQLSTPNNFHSCVDGVEDILLDRQIVKLYPNPAKDEFNVSAPEGMKLTKVQLFDLTGRFLLESEKEVVNISGLERGVYCVKVFLSDGVAVTQIVKE
ncbi:MAG: cellulase family glycosylhydrolase [Paludibacteraceae bacterium]|nr:cellulase family glycosylhydrolase [Paludibacteraceae bacterium]